MGTATIFKPIFSHMKAKHTILLIALGFCLDYIGSLSRIMHRSEAQVLLILATLLKVIGIVWLAYKVVTYDGFRRFMERWYVSSAKSKSLSSARLTNW